MHSFRQRLHERSLGTLLCPPHGGRDMDVSGDVILSTTWCIYLIYNFLIYQNVSNTAVFFASQMFTH